MTRLIRHTAIYSLSLAGLLLLSACGKSEPPATPAAPASAGTSGHGECRHPFRTDGGRASRVSVKRGRHDLDNHHRHGPAGADRH